MNFRWFFVSVFIALLFDFGGYISYSQQYNFSSYSLKEGLPQSQIRKIFQDSRGYLWIITEGCGAVQFDGHEFVTFSSDQGFSINQIRSVTEDMHGNLWFGTKGKFVSTYNGHKIVNFDSLYSDESIYSIVSDPFDNVWFGGIHGLYVYHSEKFRQIRLDTAEMEISSLFYAKDNILWVAVSNGSVYSINEEQVNKYSRREGLICNHTFSVVADLDEKIIVSTDNGVFKLNNGRFEKMQVPIPESIEISEMLTDKLGNTWMATKGDGVYRYDGELWKHFDKTNGLPNNYVVSILEDINHKIWFGTVGSGICKFEGEMFTHFTTGHGLPESPVMSIASDEKGNFWIGTYGQGAYFYDNIKFSPYNSSNGLNAKVVYTIVVTRKKEVWFGTDGNGLFRLKNGTFQRFGLKDGLPSETIFNLYEDRNGYLWIGTLGGGISIYDGEKFFNFSKKDGLSSDNIYSFHQDKNGNMWIGNDDKGIDLIYSAGNVQQMLNKKSVSGGEILNISSSLGLPNDQVLCITEDNNANIWIGTYGGGVVMLNLEKQMSFYNTKNGLNSNNIYFIHCDKNNQIWIGTDNGITRIRLDNQSKPEQLKSFGAYEGFLGIETNLNSIKEDDKGRIWMGTVKGLTIYNPLYEEPNYYEPTLRLTVVKVFQSDVDWKQYADSVYGWHWLPKYFELPLEKNYLTFKWVGIDLASPDKVHYSHILEGFDPNWSEPSTKNEVTYSYLPSGKYTLKIKARNSDGLWNRNPVTIEFRILPPFYYSRLFIVIFILVGSLIVVLISRSRKLTFEKETEILEKTIEIRTRQLLNEKLIVEQQKEELSAQTDRLEAVNHELEKLSIAASKTDNSILITDKDFNVHWVNEGFVKLFGYSLDEFIKKRGKNLAQNSFNPEIEQVLKVCIEKRESVTFSTQVETRMGQSKWVQTTLTPIYDSHGLFRQMVAVDSDITKIKEINRELEKLSIVASKTDNAVIIMNHEGVIEWVNEGFHRMYESSLTEFKRRFGTTIFDFPKNKEHKELINNNIANRQSISVVGRMFTRDGTEKWVQTTITPILEGTKLVKIIALESDITRIKEAENEVQKEKEKSDLLLLNILPAETAEELKSKGHATPRYYRNVSVMFADFQDFTYLCENLSPHEIVNELQYYFGHFDDITEKYFVEKIKTIGDAYMCVGGLPLRNRSHPFDVVLTAMEFQHFVSEANKKKIAQGRKPWMIRIGIHSGTVIAGVVGKKKFIYDIWGDSVNIASRMEASSEPGRINISGTLFELIKNHFDCSYRGKVEAKNKGAIDMYYVNFIKPAYSLNGEGLVPNDEFKNFLASL